MSSVSPCPFCGQQTTIPEHVDPASLVRCPLCEYEFPLDDALFNATEAPPEHIADLPPALVPVVQATREDGIPPMSGEPLGHAEAGLEAAAQNGPSQPPAPVPGPPCDSSPEVVVDTGPLQPAGNDAAVGAPVAVLAGTSTSPEEPVTSLSQAVDVSTSVLGPAAFTSYVATSSSQAVEASEATADTTVQESEPAAAESPQAAEPTSAAAAEAAPGPVPEPSCGAVAEWASVAATEPTTTSAAAGDGDDEPSVFTPVTPVDASLSAVVVVSCDTSTGAAVQVTIAEAPCGLQERVQVDTVAAPAPTDAAEHEDHARGPFEFGLPAPGGFGTAGAAPAWRERPRRSPIRSFIGVVLSGVLGLAVAYGLMSWLGPSKLLFWRTSKPQAVEGGNSTPANKPAKRDAKQPKMPSPRSEEPKSFEEFPGLDDSRFTDVPKNVQPSKSGKSPKGSGGRKGS